MKNSRWVRFIVFYLIAITLSNVFRFDVFNLRAGIDKLPLWTIMFFSPLEAIGVLLGAIISLKMLAKNRLVGVSVFGSSVKWSILMGVIPIILLTIIGVTNRQGSNPNSYGFFASMATFIYCFSEEIGWRGYLEEEFKSMDRWKRVLIIASLWYFWHLSFLRDADILSNIKFFGWLVLGSWGIGKMVELTKSLFVAASLHMAINIVMFNGYIRDGIEFNMKMLILGVCITVWTLILMKWMKEKPSI